MPDGRRARPVLVLVRTLAAAAVILVSALGCAGCWDYHELEDYLHVGIVGVDKGTRPGWFKVTIMVVEPRTGSVGGAGGSTSGEGPGSLVLATGTAEGPTLMAAAQATDLASNRIATFAHTEVIIIGEELAREGIGPLMDALGRTRDLRRSVLLAVTDGETAESVLETVRSDVETSTVSYITGLIDSKCTEQGVTHKALAHDALIAYGNLGQEIVLPLLKTVPKPPMPQPPGQGGGGGSSGGGAGGGGGGAGGGGGGSGGGGGARGAGEAAAAQPQKAPTQKRAEASGLAVFRDDKLVVKLSGEQAQAWNLVCGKFHRGYFTVSGPATAGTEVHFQLAHVDRRLKVERRGLLVNIDIDVRCRATLVDLGGPALIVDPGNLKLVAGLLDSKLETLMRGVIDVAKTEVKGDIFDFALSARGTFRDWPEWANYDWNKAFRAANVTVTAHVTDIRTGLTFQPPSPGE